MISNRKLNLFETIEFLCHDLDYAPHAECQPTAAAPGSLEKIQVMCERLANGESLHHPNDNQTCATMEAQHEMAATMILLAKMHREASRVKRELAQPKRVVALHAARATKQREAEVRKTKSIIRIVKNGN
jgi:hypothetical protein